MAAPKATTPQQSAAIDRRINALDLRGCTQAEIAHELGISQPSIANRLKKLNAHAAHARADHLAHELRTLDWAQREAMDAWDASKADSETVIVEQRGKGEKGKATKRTEKGTGDAAHLGNVIRISESRRKLLSLDAPTKSAGMSFTPEQLAALSDEELEGLYARLRG